MRWYNRRDREYCPVRLRFVEGFCARSGTIKLKFIDAIGQAVCGQWRGCVRYVKMQVGASVLPELPTRAMV